MEENLFPDASVLINLLATGGGNDLLSRLPFKILVASKVSREVRFVPTIIDNKVVKLNEPGSPLDPYFADGLIEPIALEEEGLELFLDLVGAEPPHDLGDGEAAVVACAFTHGGTGVIDEAKGRNVFKDLCPQSDLFSTVGLLRELTETNVFTRCEMEVWIFQALRTAKARVCPEDRDWVMDLIGLEKAKLCTSLNRHLKALGHF